MSKKSEQLGMSPSTAYGRLRKMVLFNLLQESDNSYCFQCGDEIEDIDDLSIEHMKPWLDSEDPLSLFFDLDNVAFSHLSCNSGAARKEIGRIIRHGTTTGYRYGCRCSNCRRANTMGKREWRENRSVAQSG